MAGEPDPIDHETQPVLSAQVGERPLTAVDLLAGRCHVTGVEVGTETDGVLGVMVTQVS